MLRERERKQEGGGGEDRTGRGCSLPLRWRRGDPFCLQPGLLAGNQSPNISVLTCVSVFDKSLLVLMERPLLLVFTHTFACRETDISQFCDSSVYIVYCSDRPEAKLLPLFWSPRYRILSSSVETCIRCVCVCGNAQKQNSPVLPGAGFKMPDEGGNSPPPPPEKKLRVKVRIGRVRFGG